MVPQLLQRTIRYTHALTDLIFPGSSIDVMSSPTLSYSENIRHDWDSSVKSAIDMVHTMSGTATLTTGFPSILRSTPTGDRTWKLLKRGRLSPTAPNFSNLLYYSIFAGSHVYWDLHRHDAVEFLLHGSPRLGFVEGIIPFSASQQSFPSTIVIVQLLVVAEPDHDNLHVVETYGHLRYMYSLSHSGFVHFVAVQTEALLRPTVIVTDPYLIKNHSVCCVNLKPCRMTQTHSVI